MGKHMDGPGPCPGEPDVDCVVGPTNGSCCFVVERNAKAPRDPSAMVAAILEELPCADCFAKGLDVYVEGTVSPERLITAVIDNLPREAMARAMKPVLERYSIHILGPGEPCTLVDDRDEEIVFQGSFDECQVQLWKIGIDFAIAAIRQSISFTTPKE